MTKDAQAFMLHCSAGKLLQDLAGFLLRVAFKRPMLPPDCTSSTIPVHCRHSTCLSMRLLKLNHAEACNRMLFSRITLVSCPV